MADPGYSYVAARNLRINGILAFTVGQEVPDSVVASQGWVTGTDVNAVGTPGPTQQTVVAYGTPTDGQAVVWNQSQGRYITTGAAGIAGINTPASGYVVSPSGDTTGAADTAAFNNAIGTYNRVQGVPGSTFYLNGPIVAKSHSEVSMYGCTVQLASGVLSNLIRNQATSPDVTATDVSTVANNPVITSTTLAGAAAVGDRIQVLGAALSAGGTAPSAYGTVTSKTTTTVTIDNWVETALTGATGNLYRATSRDTDITVKGGKWITGDLTSGTTWATQFCAAFRRVDGLNIRDTTWQSAGTAGLGGRFTLSGADITNATFENITFTGTAGDGLHVMGPASNVTISNVSGTTGDDMVVINTQDNHANTGGIFDTQGALSTFRISNVRGTNPWRSVKVYSQGVSKKWQIQHIVIDGVHGTQQNEGVWIGCTDYLYGLTIRNVDAQSTASGNAPSVMLNTSNAGQTISIDTVTWWGANPASNGVVQLNVPRGSIKVKNVSMARAVAGTNIGVLVQGGSVGNGSTFGTSLSIDGVYNTTGGIGTVPATFHAVSLAGATGTLDALNIRDVQGTPASGSMLLLTTAITITQCNLSDITWAGTNLVSVPSGMPALTVRAVNVSFSGTNMVATSSPFTASLVNVDGNTSMLAAPTGLAAAAVASGGSFAAATYYWKITATGANGETLPSAEASVAVVANGSATLSWTAVTGATGYRIYRATATGGQSTSPAFVASVGAVTSYTDTGAATTAGAVPTVNTTGSLVAAIGTGATPIRLRARNLTQAGTGAILSRDGTQALSLDGAAADLSILTPTDQDQVNNTNGALACGTGLAIFHTGGTGNGWKNLYSGVTY